jgi:hypothetical protein
MSFDENNHLSIGSFISVESMSDAEVSKGCFLQSFDSFGLEVSEEKIF